jgi:two-component system cell cycle sensor histidine kinase/response regulator CckA
VLTIDVAPDLAKVKADPSQIEQVLMNLVVNARDAMPTGGQLKIETSNVGDAPRTLLLPSPGPHVRVAVSDTGVGMDEETIARIFEPFFTTKERGKGTGLGLSMVFGIVKQSGGAVAVTSSIGHGATFEVYLPVTSELDAPFTIRPHEIEDALRGDETLLLVEDDEQVRVLCAKVLRQYGYDVIEAGKPSDAIAAAAAFAARIDLLLTDVVMPKMSGRQLACLLAAERPSIRTLFVSGYEAEVAHQQSGDGYLAKPFGPSALTATVRDVLGRVRPAAR